MIKLNSEINAVKMSIFKDYTFKTRKFFLSTTKLNKLKWKEINERTESIKQLFIELLLDVLLLNFTM